LNNSGTTWGFSHCAGGTSCLPFVIIFLCSSYLIYHYVAFLGWRNQESMWVEKAFDLNDWVVLSSIVVLWGIFFLVPKVVSKQTTTLIMLYGLTLSSVFDNSFAAYSLDFYDIMDGPLYTVMDFFVYFLYPPFGYFFLYFYKKFRIRSIGNIFYIFLCSLIATLIEFIFMKCNIFSYLNGYGLKYSFCVYIVVQSGLLFFCFALKNRGINMDTKRG
jgi:hypothetical protein